MGLRQVDEAFHCNGTAHWRGIELGELEYIPATRLIGGYLNNSDPLNLPAFNDLRSVERVDRTAWHARVPFAEIESLEIRHHPAPPGRPRWWPAFWPTAR